MNEEKKEINQKQETDGGKKIAIISILATLVVILVLFGAYWAWKKYSASQKDLAALKAQMENLQKSPETTGGETTITGEAGGTEATEAGTDDYTGWKTYTNSEIGYQLKYPADWAITGISEYSPVREATVKYITIYTPGNKYFLHWGLKEKNAVFYISDRTGMGAGEEKKTGKITILGTEIDITNFMFKGKDKEIFYPSAGTNSTSDGKYEFTATLSYGSGSNWDAVDLSSAPEKALAEKILRSVAITGKTVSSSGCASTLTNSEKTAIENWKTLKNSKHGYSFKYPADWKIESSQNDYAELRSSDGGEEMMFRFRSDTMTGTDYMGFREDSQKNTLIACQPASIMYLSGDPHSDPAGDPNYRLILAQFEKGSIPHLVTFFYPYIGASLSSDYVEAFDLIIKSIEFSK